MMLNLNGVTRPPEISDCTLLILHDESDRDTDKIAASFEEVRDSCYHKEEPHTDLIKHTISRSSKIRFRPFYVAQQHRLQQLQ